MQIARERPCLFGILTQKHKLRWLDEKLDIFLADELVVDVDAFDSAAVGEGLPVLAIIRCLDEILIELCFVISGFRLRPSWIGTTSLMVPSALNSSLSIAT